MSGALLLAVDVGTLSARAGVFDAAGALLGTATAPFVLRRPAPGFALYRMAEIEAAAAQAIRAALASVPGAAPRIAGLAFDATSSLVLTHRGAAPLPEDCDVFCWADHSGEALTGEIEATGDALLAHTGGSMSPEQHLPKLLGLARRDATGFARVTAARDLCDELAFRMTGSDTRSLCGLACKWPFLPAEAEPWRRDLFARLGIPRLPELAGPPPRPVGTLHGRLRPEMAARLGLQEGIAVAVGLIDAEAGTLGALGPGFEGGMNEVMALIGGTSTCIMAFARDKRLVPGVWGPFRDAVFEGVWMHEAGQSLSGAALDAVLEQHPAGPRRASAEGHAATAAEVLRLLDAEGPAFAARRHIVPDWLGNRSPLGDGAVRALLLGVGEERDARSFHEAYYATARALALQVRHIADHLDAHGYAIRRAALSGGHARNPLLLRLYRDALGRELALPRTEEPVLLGTAMVAAVAAGLQPGLAAAMRAMDPGQAVLRPDPAWVPAHAQAYAIYRRLFEARNALRAETEALASLPWR
jgi:FGGY-family pentulose kinase